MIRSKSMADSSPSLAHFKAVLLRGSRWRGATLEAGVDMAVPLDSRTYGTTQPNWGFRARSAESFSGFEQSPKPEAPIADDQEADQPTSLDSMVVR